ncbi:competence protein ComK [Niallia sp. 01092]|uniref:competence protein ComK n=1 Tax=unclassified Niallia TaxID=2837522 RepID=UPI003FD36B27
MTLIIRDYDIDEKTLALIPVKHIHYHTIVLTSNQNLYVKKTPFELIKKAALNGGSDYRGRRTSMIYLTGIKQKNPIPISESKNIFAFPTQSPKQLNCYWIFFHHVDSIKPIESASSERHSIILFKNKQKLHIKESVYLLEKQMYRTWLCKKALQKSY